MIGYSGSGKTSFIVSAIKLLKKNFNYNIVVIKNVKHHPIDKEGKDSYKFNEAGASYSVIQNINNETAIFVGKKELELEVLLNWVENGPFRVDVIFTEGFRDFYNPTVLCVSGLNEVEEQLAENVKIISGIICLGDLKKIDNLKVPIIDIQSDFLKFVKIFNLN